MLIHCPNELALAVANHRKKRKNSQKTVGNLVGLKQQTISNFENKPESTKLDTLFRILAAVNLEIHLLPRDKSIKEKYPWKEEW